jgi:hypothetical protein
VAVRQCHHQIGPGQAQGMADLARPVVRVQGDDGYAQAVQCEEMEEMARVVADPQCDAVADAPALRAVDRAQAVDLVAGLCESPLSAPADGRFGQEGQFRRARPCLCKGIEQRAGQFGRVAHVSAAAA